ncbi:hypothetical protein [Bradyrhizobium sp. LMG 9283]|uniref:hypothetical protein n=1 Tax=Bradyrhizobium sp. LMG 9283 TaxID=592064 RepID=UPI00388DD882
MTDANPVRLLKQKHPVRHIRRQQVSYRAKPLQLISKSRGISHWRMQQEVADRWH